MSMSKTYKSYDKELKKTLVSLYEKGKKISDLSREYDINESTIRPWIKKYGTIITSTGEVTNNDEILKLKKKLHEVELENEIPTVIMNPIGYYPHNPKEFVNKKSLDTLYNIYLFIYLSSLNK